VKSSKKRVFGKKEEKKNAKNGEKTEAQTIKKKVMRKNSGKKRSGTRRGAMGRRSGVVTSGK